MNSSKADEWIKASAMGRRGLAEGKPRDLHLLTEEGQGTYHFTYGSFPDPVLRVNPGDVIEVETIDAFGGAIRTERDLPSQVIRFPFTNPQNGPIHINGAEKGDVLAVLIKSIEPRGEQPVGTTVLMANFGGLVGTRGTAMLHEPLPELVRKMVVTTQGVQFSDTITLPYEPFIGTLGVSPELEAVSSARPDYWGGNMDLPDMGVGTIAYFPISTAGAYLYLGDCHAVQGDGELAGGAIEMAARVVIQVDLIKRWSISWPRLETETYIMAIGSARPMEDAARIAYKELITWLVNDYGFDKMEAYLLLTQIGKIRVGNMVDPNYSLGASILKRYLA